MTKICFITTVSLTLDAFVLDLSNYIHSITNWDITFVCNNDEVFAKKLPNYIHYHPIEMKRGISIGGINAIFKMKHFFKEQQFDIIQYSTPNASLYASIAGKSARIPVRLYCQWGMAYVGFSGFKRRVFKIIEKVVCGNSTWIEPDSFSNLRFAHQEGLYPDSIGSVIGKGSACGVNLNKFDISSKQKYKKSIRDKYQIPDNAFVFGFVGRITRDKGINELLFASKLLFDKHPNAWLLIVGHAEKDKNVDNDLYDWAQKNKRIIFTGFTSVVEQYISAMDCFVLPSYREGFGMSVVESEAMGIPVVVTDIPGPIDGMIKDKTGLIVQKKDALSLVRAMEKMLMSPNLCEEFSKNGVRFATENFEQTELFRQIYEDRLRLIDESRWMN